MNTDLKKVVFSCLTGSLIGMVIAIAIQGYFWWVGAIIGAVVSGVVSVADQIPSAFRYAWKKAPELYSHLKTFGKIVRAGLYEGGFAMMTVLLAFVVSAGVLIAVISIFYWILVTGQQFSVFQLKNTPDFWGGWCLATLASLCSGAVLYFRHEYVHVRGTWIGIIALSPLILPISVATVAVYGLYKIFISLPRITRASWKFIVATGRFTKSVFVFIHKDLMILCMTDTFLGVYVGYLARGQNALASVIIGGLLGALFGAINFEIVSKRWLKLVPVWHLIVPAGKPTLPGDRDSSHTDW